ncbi:S-adenosyl-L-methionine-dependent methyltransferase [Hypoxylon trugodes]|uniref:S-adenosyl-L-methionine-dependent methyltransferase n=1 Tax=Hypoxylon trugodes TaxID=326681 RepID=UPI00219FDA19|nr:S-adenosyl-L-methionine-dependent methyltransferase [Hypoxylon trugodes]KAI1392525.1 S-adenosyl-L-methionine-dependent methyltransferase [Hypoxylon trugodes]
MPSENDYVLARDYLDNSRLNLYHYHWIDVFGYRTHPKIPIDGSDLRIADVGTGTGVWLTDLGARLPSSVQLDALDVSFHALPPKEWLPQNVTVRHWDVKGDVLDDLVGVYDVVNMRNFVFVIKNDEIKHVLANLLKILKPGGYLQWGESDIHDWRIDKIHPDNKTDAHKRLMEMTLGQDLRLQATWVGEMTQLFSEAGFEDVEMDFRKPEPHLAFAMHQCQLIIHEIIPRQTRNESVRNEVERLLPEVHKETVAGACFAITRRTVIGRKPKV